MQGGEITHHLLVLVLLVSMHSLGVLAQVIQTRELFPAVAGERTFASVFSVGGKQGRISARHENEIRRLSMHA